MEGTEEVPEEISKMYQEITNVDEDDKLVVTTLLKIARIGEEISEVEGMFMRREISSYEALARIEVLLGLTLDIRSEVKGSL